MTSKHVDPSSGATPQDLSHIYEKIQAGIEELREAFRAYIALEHLISPDHEDEEDSFVPPSRADLGALLHMMNADILQRLAVLKEAIYALSGSAAPMAMKRPPQT